MKNSIHPGPVDIAEIIGVPVSLDGFRYVDAVPDDFKPVKSFRDSERYRQVTRDKQGVRQRATYRRESVMVRNPHTAGDGVKVNPRWDDDRPKFEIDMNADPWRVPPITPDLFAYGRNGKKDTKIGKTVYESRTAAARAKGVKRQTIMSAARRGTLDNVGKGPKGKKVKYGNKFFKSFSELGRHLGVHRNTAAHHYHKGTIELIGVGRGARTDMIRDRVAMANQGSRICTNFTWRGKVWPDVPTAAKAENVTESAVYQHIRRTGQGPGGEGGAASGIHGGSGPTEMG